jgi:hypothetical protein
VETLTYSSGRASGCDSPGLLNSGSTLLSRMASDERRFSFAEWRPAFLSL